MASQEDNLILFFHEQSPACQKLKQFLPKDKKIQIVNVAQTPNVPREITSIPALVVNNKEVLLGKKVFDYFNKSDEMEYFNFSGKGGSSAFGFSTLDDNGELGGNDMSGGMFSSIDATPMNEGVPEWNDESDGKAAIDLDRIQIERDSMFKSVERQ